MLFLVLSIHHISNSQEVNNLLKEISRNRGAITDIDAGYSGLGFRGIILEFLSDDGAEVYDLPPIFKIGSGGSQNDAKGLEIVERLIQSLSNYTVAVSSDTPITFDSALLERYLLELLDQPTRTGTVTESDGAASARLPLADTIAATAVTCYIERGKFNPGFWNASNVIGLNNCYNYASNWRTNTFAQPGRGTGRMYTSLTCEQVAQAAIADGLHRRFDCFPDSEKPRPLMALVVAPGFDYHWYRLQQEPFWGHKPGGTAARNTDNKGVVITNPETCDRGGYTEFCGYFYGSMTQRKRIR
jgi:hypothetical protein